MDLPLPRDRSVRQVIDVLVLEKRDLAATRQFFTRALAHGLHPSEVSTDRAPAYPRGLDELVPSACHVVEQYANYPIEAEHGQFKARLRPMRGLKRLRSVKVISAGHAFVQNLAGLRPMPEGMPVGAVKLLGVELDENVVGHGGNPWLGCVVVVSAGEGKADYLVPGGKACGHLVAVLLGAEPVAAGTKVR